MLEFSSFDILATLSGGPSQRKTSKRWFFLNWLDWKKYYFHSNHPFLRHCHISPNRVGQHSVPFPRSCHWFAPREFHLPPPVSCSSQGPDFQFLLSDWYNNRSSRKIKSLKILAFICKILCKSEIIKIVLLAALWTKRDEKQRNH